MNKNLSVFMLFAGSSIYKLMLLFVLLAAAQCGLFGLALTNAITTSSALDMAVEGVEYIFTSSRVFWVTAAAFLLMTAQLCRVGCNFGSSQSYTLHRLRIGKKKVFILQAAFNTLCYLLLWAVQLGIALLLCHWYVSAAGESGNQTVMLAFYRHKFLHSLLPLSDISRYIRNILLMLALGVSSARFVWSNHRGKPGADIIAMVSLVLVFFAGETTAVNTDYLVSFCSSAVAFGGLYSVLMKEVEDEED